MQTNFYGVGVGPGDPELLTLKAVKVLEKVDYIFVPQSSKEKESIALSIIKEKINCEDRIIKLTFPMTYDQEKLKLARKEAALSIKEKLKEGNNAAFITIGDPLLYSTYIYILKRLKNTDFYFKINTVPGISSIGAATAKYNLPLAKNDENIAILTEVKDKAKLKQIFRMFDNVVIMKLSKNFEKVKQLLNQMELKDNSFIINKCGHEEEFFTEDLDSINANDINYLSLMMTKKAN